MFKKYIWQVLLFFSIIVIYLQRSCNSSLEKKVIETKITIPKKVGEIIKYKEKKVYLRKDSIIYTKGEVIYTDNQIDKKLAEEYKKTKDSLTKFKMYIDAIQIKEQSTTFDNKDLVIKVKSKVRGNLENIAIEGYEIKKSTQEIEIPIKVKPSIYTGLGVTNSKEFDNLTIQAEIGLQIKKDIISITADTKQNFGIKYQMKL
jgi:hypothetical protein